MFSRSGAHKTKETHPTRPGSPTPCKQGLRLYADDTTGYYSDTSPTVLQFVVSSENRPLVVNNREFEQIATATSTAAAGSKKAPK